MFYFLRLFLGIVTICLLVSVGVHLFLFGTDDMDSNTDPIIARSGMVFTQDMLQTRDTYSGLLLAGTAAQNNRDWEAARVFFDTLSRKFTTSSANMLRSMTLSLSAGEYDKALELAHKINDTYLTGDQEETQAEQFDLARLLLIADSIKHQQDEKASEYIDALTEGAIASFTKPVMGMWMDARNNADTLDSKTVGLSAVQILYKALAADFANKPKVAEHLFQKLSNRAMTAQTFETIAAFHIRQGNTDRAIEILEKGTGKYPNNPYLRKALMDVQADDKTYEAPAFTTTHLNGSASGIAIAFADFSRLLAAETAFDSALIFARLATYMDADLPGIRMVIGDIMALQGQNDRALDAYRLVQKEDLDYIAAQIEMADIYNDEGRIEDAIHVIEQVIDEDAEQVDSNIYLTLANLYKADNQFDKAVEFYNLTETMVLNDDENLQPEWLWFLYYFRGVSYDMLDEHDKAEADLKKALELQPNNATVLNYLGYTYADHGRNLEAAFDMISRAVEQKPDDAYIVDSMGWVLYRMGRYEEAVQYLETAAELRPYNSVINDHLGDAYWKVGRELEAKYMWQRAVDYILNNKVTGLDADDEEQAKAAEKAAEKLKYGFKEETEVNAEE